MRPPESARDEYGKIATCYDRLESFLKRARQGVTRAVLIAQCRRVLDVCCGTGTQVFLLRAAGVPAFGIDLSFEMLRRAVRKAGGQAAFVRGDARRLPYPAESFDGVVISFALHEKPFPHRRIMLAESRRVLTPGGTLFLMDYVRPTHLRARLFLGAVALIERSAGWTHYRAFRDHLRRGGTDTLLAELGIQILSRTLFLHDTVGLYVGRW